LLSLATGRCCIPSGIRATVSEPTRQCGKGKEKEKGDGWWWPWRLRQTYLMWVLFYHDALPTVQQNLCILTFGLVYAGKRLNGRD
jgi:hypothetical protein